MCISSTSNITFPCKICKTNIKDTDSAAQNDIRQFWIHKKCNNLNHIDYKYHIDYQIILGSASHVVMKSFHLEH